MSKCSGEHQHHHDIICLRAKDAEIASLRAEIGNSEAVRLGMEKKIADLKDGLTAAHMDGFASGKAEAKEMLRKRDGQLEVLRAEVKAYREVEDSLQKEIKRLDAWVNDLQSGMYINCVYCGHRYGPQDKVPCSMAEALKKHIEQCPKHPMSALKQDLAATNKVIEGVRTVISDYEGDEIDPTYALFSVKQLLPEDK